MKISRNKILAAIASILMLSITFSILALPDVGAHQPSINIQPWVYITASPDPAAVNQRVYLVFWNTIAPPDAMVNNSIRWVFSLSATSPSNVTTPIGTFASDVNGKASTYFTPTEVGTWTVNVTFPETKYLWSSSPTQRLYYNDTFLASSYLYSLTVQNQTVPQALPSEYSPIGVQGDWFKVTSNYMGDGSYQSWGNHNQILRGRATGSLTGHVMWTKSIEPGGVVGGTDVGVPGDAFYSGLAYARRFVNTFILDGKLYYREPLGETGQNSGYIAVDLRTGTEIVRSSVTSLGMGYSCNGITAFMSTSFGSWYDPNTLRSMTAPSLSGAPTAGTTITGPNDEVLRIGFTQYGSNWNIWEWNSSRVLKTGVTGSIPANTADCYDFNVTVTYNGNPFPLADRTLYFAAAEDFALTSTLSTSGANVPANGTFRTWMISLKPATRGQIVANYTFDTSVAPMAAFRNDGHLAATPAVIDDVNRVIPLWSWPTRQWLFVNFETGQVGGPTGSETPWDYYGSPSGTEIQRDSLAMDGKLVSVQYGGIMYIYDTKTCKLENTLGMAGSEPNANITSAGFQTVYGVYPTLPGKATSSNGRVYVFVNEHSPNTPLLKGSYFRCVDILNAREDWIDSSYGGQHTTDPSSVCVGNGYTVNLNSHNEQIFCYGPGPSKTTVSTSTQDTTPGSKILIEGTVLDDAAGTRQTEQIGRFPNGIACVSDDNMTDWMTYIYINRPRPENVLGVNVTLMCIGIDGIVQEIGTTTTDSSGYFNYLWTPPPIAGNYTVIASFEGTNAYYPSYAQSTLTLSTPPLQSITPSPTPQQMDDSFILTSTGAIIALIIIITIGVAVLLRKTHKVTGGV